MSEEEPDDLDKLHAEQEAKDEAEFYETLEEKIDVLRETTFSQAHLLKEMQMAAIMGFCNRVIELEQLQRKYDEWEPVE